MKGKPTPNPVFGLEKELLNASGGPRLPSGNFEPGEKLQPRSIRSYLYFDSMRYKPPCPHEGALGLCQVVYYKKGGVITQLHCGATTAIETHLALSR